MKLVHHDYQKKAIQFLIENEFSGLFLDPGLGKTAISLSYIKFAKEYLGVKKVLIIAPKRVCRLTWPDEIKKWSRYKGLKYAVLRGRERDNKLKKDYDIYLINRESLPWLLKATKMGTQHPFDVLIVDESTKFKTWSAKYTRMLLKMLKGFKRRHILTGTPAPNGYIDLFSQIFLLDLGKALGDKFTHFLADYFTYNQYKFKYTLRTGAEKTIQNKMQHLVLRMSEDDYLSLPERTDNVIYVELADEALLTYNDLEKKLFAEIEGTELVLMNSSAGYNACRQVASGNLYHQDGTLFGPALQGPKNRRYYSVHDEKVEALEDLIESLAGSPLLVAYHFNHELDRLLAKWPGTPFIGKGVSDKDSDRIVKDWNQGIIPFLFCQPGSMSHGLNMQKVGRNVCWFALTDNLEDYIQFNKRVHRQGVSGSVIVHHIVAKDTVDEVILRRNTRKNETQNSLLSALRDYMMQKV